MSQAMMDQLESRNRDRPEAISVGPACTCFFVLCTPLIAWITILTLFLVNKDDFDSMSKAVPDIKIPAERVIIIYGVLSLLPFLVLLSIAVFPPLAGVLLCINCILSAVMLAYACVGLDIVYDDSDWRENIEGVKEYTQLSETL